MQWLSLVRREPEQSHTFPMGFVDFNRLWQEGSQSLAIKKDERTILHLSTRDHHLHSRETV